MAPSRDQVTASEAPIAVHRSQEYVQIWLLSAVSTILSKRKLLPQRCFKTVTLQTSPGRLTYENFLQSTAASAPTNGGTKLIILDQHSGERADGLFQLLTKSIFPALREKSLVAFQFYLTEDPRAYTKAIEAYTICVTHDGLPDINIRHTPTAAPPVATVFNDLAKSLREYEKFLTNLPPLPRDRFGFITTWHTQTASTAPIGMFAAPAEPHLWPVKQGWKAYTFLPEAVRVGAEEYHTVGLGAVCMKPTSGLNKKPIRSVSDTELAYDDAETYGQEFLVFDAETSTTKDHFPLAVSSFVSRDLDVPPESPSQHPPRRGAKPVNTQNSTISVGDQRRKSELQRV
ncbi:Uracil catabolism protein 4 [Elsinoe australis]|uniref:Uracil catabolism protein 4 n=1 Tax=Elsinoe australis TaxID=40998 RepID=A0A2P7YJ44_9PEZI|nr:Uracil catabolism protein 4 [Elsinoe australis]